jgi:para-aminobenzoate synthetase component I
LPNYTNSLQQQNLKWQNPLNFAKKVSDNYSDDWVFLYSALSDKVSNSVSYIALFPNQEIITESFSEIENITKDKKSWFGYLSYELGQQFEELPKSTKSYINLPKIWLINFAVILQFDHDKEILTAFFDDKANLAKVLNYEAKMDVLAAIKVKNIQSNFSDEDYLAEISDIKNMIAKGDFYQTNLTRKFFGKLDIKDQRQSSYFSLFSTLCKLSPANYSAFLSLKNNYVISASPELFLTINDQKIAKSCPIKGTTPRSDDKKQDQENKLELKNSAKEKAENLMIVDLVRNDLSRFCEIGSVEVQKLFEITSYKTIHHLSSEIVGKVKSEFSVADILKACFPAGSMTGAPKIKAMQIASLKEKIDRGVYSGAIGILGENQVNLSVVIRTLICRGDDFEFQVGGAITFDSDEKKELEEIFNKAKGILELLGIGR